ncbi:hypothetical protein JQN72_17680 [Phycicoccus sp. CSK15P-2]|uniref:N-terminal phage integrase SAM-like domain-containing protein n=1 Tax=Phycicoccus sp. CSK15P-2 TaxID=2807627 RepID=UPI001951D096|nr:N-terminal phage integrase SAM-like domain-containing protein [Phycicoccus sp. CSK15P-2]MBM6406070.1 hypothetical protein [Phycicoccus sp. CSK15P-2]
MFVAHMRQTCLFISCDKSPFGQLRPVSPRLRDFLRRWLREKVKPNLSPTTAANYEMFARLYIVPDLGNRPLDKLMVRDVQVWVNALRTRCQCCSQGKDRGRRDVGRLRGLNRPGSGGGSQSMEDESHGGTEEVQRRAA